MPVDGGFVPPAGLPGVVVAGFLVGGVAIGFGVEDGMAVFADGVFGVGVGFTDVFESFGIGTRIIPLSCGMNWLPPFGSIVTDWPGGGTYPGGGTPFIGCCSGGAPSGGDPPLAQAL